MKFDTSTVLVTVLGCLFSYRITQIIQIRVQIITNILVSKWMHNLHYIYYIIVYIHYVRQWDAAVGEGHF